jgi:valyl-tRNA synthetase
MENRQLPSRYDAAELEQRWYATWEQAGLFKPDANSDKTPFVITIPPPNITGSLHMGHALCYPIQDALARYNRLLGKNVLILPGQDHAGIATQSVVEKQLRKQGTSGAQIGREKFIERVWEWRKESGDTILNQLRRLGCSFDWDRIRFTLDEGYAKSVLKVFIDWYDRGYIYKGKRVVNWDPVLKTSVSDIETERKIVKSKLYYIRYPFKDGSGDITIATTRPETMLADVAVAAHPSDARYKDLFGKTLILPLLNREIPLIADQYPDPAFGSGAVKITPAHDPNDYEVGVRHNLEMPVLLNESGKLTDVGGPYAGLDRYDARKRVIADLQEQGYLVKIEDYEIPLIISERSGEVIEPLLSEQWFVSQTKLAGPAIKAVKEGKVKFFPERYERIYLDWMENIRDWCVSRQLWWGHRIPVYYDEQGSAYAALSWDDAQKKAGDNKIVRQDEDVLDTWFSSGLWPFATLGWPDQAEDLKSYYPTSTMVTDRNIIYLWVARMIMMGLDFMGEVPFSEVFIYATVLTEDGRRMSKSLGTGVDPMGIIEKIGADPLRYALLCQTGHNQDIRYSERRTEEARNFCTKIWNAVRFVLMNCDKQPEKPRNFETTDKWLLSRLYETEKTVREAYQGYDMQLATQTLYKFFWSELCDWYIEVSKKRLNDESTRETPQWVLLKCIEAFVKMMHPIMPYLTEEIYSHLPIEGKSKYLMTASWPEIPVEFYDPDIQGEVERCFEVTRALRALRAELDLPAIRNIPRAYYEGELGEGASIVSSQAWVDDLIQGKPAPDEKVLSMAVAGIDLHLPYAGLVDREKLIAQLAKDIEKTESDLARCDKRLSDENFTQRAKPEIVERERQAADELRARLDKLFDRKKLFSE